VRWGWLFLLALSLPLHAAPDAAQKLFQLGSDALSQKQSKTAIRYFEQALERNDAMTLAWRGLGVALGQENRWLESAKAHRRATRLAPTVAQGWLNLGWAEHRSGKDKVAQKVLAHAAQLDPQNPDIANAQGVVYLFLNQPLEAEAATRRVLTLDPINGTAFYNLGLALHLQKRWSDAIEALLAAKRYEPRNPHPLIALALTYADAGDEQRARTSYRQTLNLDPRYRDIHYLSQLTEADFSAAQIERLRQYYPRWQKTP
jgi:tetratricopeptide (TPR) repeat protein